MALTTDYRPSRVLRGHKKAISSVRFSPDGKWLASSSNDKTVQIWDPVTGEKVSSLVGHSLGISDVAWSPDSATLATASDDTNVCLWSRETSRRLNTFKGHTNYVMCVNFSPKGDLLATGSFDYTVRLWDIKSGSCVHRFSAHNDVVVSAQFDGDGTHLVTGGFDGFIRVWDVAKRTCIREITISSPDIPVCFANWSPNSRFILVGSFDGSWKLVDSETWSIIRKYTGHVFNDYCIFSSFSLTGGKYIISGSADRTVCIWDINSETLLQKLEGHSDVVVAVAAHPTENIIASGALDADNTVRLWRLGSELDQENIENKESEEEESRSVPLTPVGSPVHIPNIPSYSSVAGKAPVPRLPAKAPLHSSIASKSPAHLVPSQISTHSSVAGKMPAMRRVNLDPFNIPVHSSIAGKAPALNKIRAVLHNAVIPTVNHDDVPLEESYSDSESNSHSSESSDGEGDDRTSVNNLYQITV